MLRRIVACFFSVLIWDPPSSWPSCAHWFCVRSLNWRPLRFLYIVSNHLAWFCCLSHTYNMGTWTSRRTNRTGKAILLACEALCYRPSNNKIQWKYNLQMHIAQQRATTTNKQQQQEKNCTRIARNRNKKKIARPEWEQTIMYVLALHIKKEKNGVHRGMLHNAVAGKPNCLTTNKLHTDSFYTYWFFFTLLAACCCCSMFILVADRYSTVHSLYQWEQA